MSVLRSPVRWRVRLSYVTLVLLAVVGGAVISQPTGSALIRHSSLVSQRSGRHCSSVGESLPFDARLERLRFQAGIRLISPLLNGIVQVPCRFPASPARHP